jgi:Tfp pilus assembly protein PilO
MKLSPEKQKKFLLTLIIVVGVAAGLWFFVITYLRTKDHKDTKALAQLKQDTKNRRDDISKERRNRQMAQSYVSYIANAEKQMPQGVAETWLVQQLGEIAGKHEISISNTAVQSIKPWSEFKFKDQPYQLVGFRFELKGEFNQIGKFLEDIENNVPLMEVDDISITAGSDISPHVHTVSIRVSMVTKS